MCAGSRAFLPQIRRAGARWDGGPASPTPTPTTAAATNYTRRHDHDRRGQDGMRWHRALLRHTGLAAMVTPTRARSGDWLQRRFSAGEPAQQACVNRQTRLIMLSAITTALSGAQHRVYVYVPCQRRPRRPRWRRPNSKASCMSSAGPLQTCAQGECQPTPWPRRRVSFTTRTCNPPPPHHPATATRRKFADGLTQTFFSRPPCTMTPAIHMKDNVRLTPAAVIM